MRIPLLSSKKVVQEITPVLIVKYVLPKRELVKIAVTVIGLEFLMHAPVRKAWVEKAEGVVDKVETWLDGEPGSAS